MRRKRTTLPLLLAFLGCKGYAISIVFDKGFFSMAGEFLKELEEDIHHEEWVHFWHRRGPLIAVLVIATLLGTGGYLWWNSHQETKREQDSDLYEKGVTSLNLKGPTAEAESIFKKLSGKSDRGYGLLSRLQLLRLYSLKLKGTPQILDTLLKEQEAIRHIAQKDRNLGLEGIVFFSLGYADLDSPKALRVTPSSLFKGLKEYETPQNPWKSLSLELQGLYLLKNKDSKASGFYKTLLSTPDLSQSVRLRMSMEAISEGFSFPLRPHE